MPRSGRSLRRRKTRPYRDAERSSPTASGHDRSLRTGMIVPCGRERDHVLTVRVGVFHSDFLLALVEGEQSISYAHEYPSRTRILSEANA